MHTKDITLNLSPQTGQRSFTIKEYDNVVEAMEAHGEVKVLAMINYAYRLKQLQDARVTVHVKPRTVRPTNTSKWTVRREKAK